jgi:hypothetical protein
MSKQPKMRVLPDGSKEWLLRGKLHREDGPAREDADGTKNWCLNGKLHRIDGPAVEWDDRPSEWFLNGKKVSWQDVFRQANDPEIELRILSHVDNFLT